MLVGIDDTDSLKGGCTTYIASIICGKLGTTTYPRLIRLNPNIPFKTRGNGAVSLEFKGGKAEEIKRNVLETVKENAHLNDKETNPGVAFLEELGPEKKKYLNEFYKKAVSELVTPEEAEETASRAGIQTHRFNNGRGIIGAVAAIGARLDDKTYELLAYRKEENQGKPKRIDKGSVFAMNEKCHPHVFNSIDPETGQILLTPRGHDPVFCGIRGESPEAVMEAWEIINPLEEIERVQIFETNQATDAHLCPRKISQLKPYDCAVLKGKVYSEPRRIEGGHVIFTLSDDTGRIDCAAYKPTGGFRETAMKLTAGDTVRACGGIGRHKETLNLERIETLKLEKRYEKEPPLCCGRRMTSAGKGKGFRCRKCSNKKREGSTKRREIPRELKQNTYGVPPRAMRHLSKPILGRGP